MGRPFIAWYLRHRPEVWLVACSIGVAELLTGSTPFLSRALDPLTRPGLLRLAHRLEAGRLVPPSPVLA